MNINELNELKRASKKGKCFLVMENEHYEVVEDIAILPYKNTTIGIHLEQLENSYNADKKALEERLDKQDKIIKELRNAIDSLNKKGV